MKLYWLAVWPGASALAHRKPLHDAETKPRAPLMYGFPTLAEARKASEMMADDGDPAFYDDVISPGIASGRIAFKSFLGDEVHVVRGGKFMFGHHLMPGYDEDEGIHRVRFREGWRSPDLHDGPTFAELRQHTLEHSRASVLTYEQQEAEQTPAARAPSGISPRVVRGSPRVVQGKPRIVSRSREILQS
jgi:hypothetical protein